MADLLQTKVFSITDTNGEERTLFLSKFPAIQGREIIAKYPTTALPKVGDYAVNEETMLKLMCFVGVRLDDSDKITPLNTRALVNNHVGDWETLAKIEMAMMEYNCSFFRNGRASDFLTVLVQIAMGKISEILTASSAPSSQTAKQP